MEKKQLLSNSLRHCLISFLAQATTIPTTRSWRWSPSEPNPPTGLKSIKSLLATYSPPTCIPTVLSRWSSTPSRNWASWNSTRPASSWAATRDSSTKGKNGACRPLACPDRRNTVLWSTGPPRTRRKWRISSQRRLQKELNFQSITNERFEIIMLNISIIK